MKLLVLALLLLAGCGDVETECDHDAGVLTFDGGVAHAQPCGSAR